MAAFFSTLLDPSGFLERERCGDWTPGLVWLHGASDILIWLAYLSIPLILGFFAWRRWVPFHALFWLFAAFILACGFTHMIDAATFHYPVYRLHGLVKAITAGISWATVLAMVGALPRALDLRWDAESTASIPTDDRDGSVNWRGYLVAAACLGLAMGVRGVTGSLVTDNIPFLPFLVGIVFASWFGGLGPALLTLLGGVAFHVYSLGLSDDRSPQVMLAHQLGAGFYVVSGLAVALISEARLVAHRRVRSTMWDLTARREELEAEVRRRVEVESDLRESEARFRLLSEALPVVVWTATPAGDIEYYNRRWYEYTGLGHDETRGQGWREIIHPDDREEGVRAWAEARRRGDLHEVEQRLRRADGGHRWQLVRGVPLRDARGAIVQWVGSITDIDDQRRQTETLEHMVRERTAELQRSNSELEQFASVASHDLQEPLRKIQAFGDRLRTRYRDDLNDQGRDDLDRILNAAGRMRTLIDDLLRFARVATKTQPFAPVALDAIAREALSDLEGRVQQSDGQVEIGPLPTIDADPVQMRQLFQNLLGNALKFHKPGERPHVRVEGRPLPPEEAPEDPQGRRWFELSVADRGIGFEETYLDRIFQVFQRLHARKDYEGTGVGLAICRKIVERHGGRITARSEPGRGTIFLVTLPEHQPREGT